MEQHIEFSFGIENNYARRDPTTSLSMLLHGVLKTIIRLPWLHLDAGGVFLYDPINRQLELVVHINFEPKITGACDTVKLGHCLCGRVAETKALLHVDRVDCRHETQYEGMVDHGHYVVPITADQELLGVLTLYVKAGHVYQPDEADVLQHFAAVMATIIQTHRVQKDKLIADLILEHSAHGIMIADRRKRILWVNPAFEEMTGYSYNEVRGRSPAILSSGRHDAEFYRNMWSTIEQNGSWQGEIWNRRKNGEIYLEFLNIIALKDANGQVQRYAGLFIDLTELRQAEERIRRLAYFDPLTGLPNRANIIEMLDRLFSHAKKQKSRQRYLILLIDLDRFHEINTALGREAGDALLRETAHRLKDALNDMLLARLERDQYLVAVEASDDEEQTGEFLNSVVERVQAALKPDFSFYDQDISLQSTIGVAQCDGSRYVTVEELLARANLALLKAKRKHRGGVVVYDDSLGREAEFDHYIVLNIQHVVKRNELYLVYQPQYDIQGALTGAETLVRWRSPQHGLIAPDRFIPHAEKRGAIGSIGYWVFEQAIEQFFQWRNDCIKSDKFRLSVNLSPAQLIGRDVVDFFVDVCQRKKIPTACVEIEITETAIMQASTAVSDQITALSAAGFHVAIDDFGTGHSSLSRLHQLPIGTFKIDRSFIGAIERGGKYLAIVKSMIAMAHELGQTVVAEGVETERQFEILRGLGCEFYQGYWFAKPLTSEEFAHCARQMEHSTSRLGMLNNCSEFPDS